MSKFNSTVKNTNKTVNQCGYPAYKMSDKEHLVTAVLTTMFGEPKYYGSTDNDIVRLATECAKKDPEFLCKLTCYARNVANMRSISHVLAAVIAREAPAFTRITIRNVVVRPDDITEIMSCYQNMYGKPFPNAMKREIAEVMQKFNEYQLAKYNSNSKALKFRDVLSITHPTPHNEEIAALFGKVMNDTLETPYTWEVELSTRGNTKEVWDELIASGKVGYMALLRNLRNIIVSGTDITPVLNIISNPEQVRKSHQLPFRFYSAYKTLTQEGCMTKEVHMALERALCASIDNMEQIKGRTLIAIDISGSMSNSISGKSDVRCCDISSLMGAMANHICEDATVCYFSSVNWNNKKGYHIAKYGKYDSILSTATNNASASGGTDMSLPMKYALCENNVFVPFDRVIYFSDNECNRSVHSFSYTVQSQAEEYRNKFNPNFWVHGIDLQGYGTQQFFGNRFNLIAGWSDTVLPFINLAERGIGTLVTTIQEYDVKE